jgi:hypothetical protein
MKGVRRWILRQFRKRGIVIKRALPDVPPPILDCPLEALHRTRGGKIAAFHCRIDLCVFKYGFQFGPQGWHHYAAALEEYRAGVCSSYQGSVLQKYYDQWHPSNMVESLETDLGPVSDGLRRQPAYAFLPPWSAKGPAETLASQRASEEAEDRAAARRYGLPAALEVELGSNNHGPVHPLKGEIEYRRLVEVYHSLERRGYDRSHGDIGVISLRRGEDSLFLVEHGYHRLAAMRVLGAETIPAGFRQPDVVDVADAPYWPQVRRGVWTLENARRYIDHLFDFDSRAWASEQGFPRGVRNLPRERSGVA